MLEHLEAIYCIFTHIRLLTRLLQSTVATYRQTMHTAHEPHVHASRLYTVSVTNVKGSNPNRKRCMKRCVVSLTSALTRGECDDLKTQSSEGQDLKGHVLTSAS